MKYKHIKAAAHNVAHSFTSLMNYGVENYVMSYLAHAAATSGEPELRVDLLWRWRTTAAWCTWARCATSG